MTICVAERCNGKGITILSRDAKEQGRFEEVKTRLTTKREEEYEGGEIIVHVAANTGDL